MSVRASPQRLAREFALQALYQWIVARNAPDEVDTFTRGLAGFHKADAEHYARLLHGCIAQAQDLDHALAPFCSRKLESLSPVEHAALWIGAYELRHCPLWSAASILNEAIELAKRFGGAQGHRFVNGALDKLAKAWRADCALPAPPTQPSADDHA